MKVLLALVVLAPAAFAQTGPVAPVPSSLQLMKYLDLTPDQLIRIQSANGDFNRLVADKSRRMSQVQREIVEETGKSPLDPMALGLRYAELEAIRRELRAEEAKVTPRVLSILTDAQKARLKGLEDAMKLQPLFCEAMSMRLIDTPDAAEGGVIRNPFPGNIIPVSGAVGTFLPGANGCPVAFTPVISAP